MTAEQHDIDAVERAAELVLDRLYQRPATAANLDQTISLVLAQWLARYLEQITPSPEAEVARFRSAALDLIGAEQ